MSEPFRTVATLPDMLRVPEGAGFAYYKLAFMSKQAISDQTSQSQPMRRRADVMLGDDGILVVNRQRRERHAIEVPTEGAPRTLLVDVGPWQSILLVPTSLHGLVLDQDRVCVGPSARFDRLPREAEDGKENATTAYLSRNVATRPFDPLDFTLRRGIHLHWMLPGALRRASAQGILRELAVDGEIETLDGRAIPGRVVEALKDGGLELSKTALVEVVDPGRRWVIQDVETDRRIRLRIAERPIRRPDDRTSLDRRLVIYDPRTRFPAVPTRWLVTRRGGGLAERRWIVESDYLGEPLPEKPGVSAAYPIEGGFARLGRAQPFEHWQPEREHGARYLPELTAIGYGEPTFAAFYPNCYSVFGFHDPDTATLSADAFAGLTYDVAGWYRDGQPDFLQSPGFLDRVEDKALKYGMNFEGGEGVELDGLREETLEVELDWPLAERVPAPFPEQMLCHARLHVDAPVGDGAVPERAAVAVAIGSSTSEAVASLIANDFKIREVRNAPISFEEQLQALSLDAAIDAQGHEIPLRFRLRKARHESCFAAIDAGRLWQIARLPATGEGDREVAEADDLPEGTGALLDALNAAQTAYNRAREELASRQAQLFADWHGYLDAAVPDPEQDGLSASVFAATLRRYCVRISMPEIKTSKTRLGDLLADCARRHAALADHLSAAAPPSAAAGRLVLRAVPAPRYWRPRDPVLVISGEGLDADLHHEIQTAVPCFVAQFQGSILTFALGLGERIDAIEAADPGAPGLHHVTRQRRRNFLLEWEATVARPQEAGRSHEDYRPDFLTSGFDFDDDGPDLVPKRAGFLRFSSETSRMTGRSIIGLGAKGQLGEVLRKALHELILPIRRAMEGIVEGDWTVDELVDWVLTQRPGGPTLPLIDLARMYKYVFVDNEATRGPMLSLTLGGFHDALLMRARGMQLPVDHPGGFPEERAFASRVRDAVEDHGTAAPIPEAPFNPLRTGRLELKSLRLVDCFGRVLPLDLGDRPVRTPSVLADPDKRGAQRLPPRLVQPARLSFRWIAADAAGLGPEAEANSAEETSPVCGWLIHNHLDCSLAVHSADGAALGRIDREGVWRRLAGAPEVALPDLPDPHLRRVVRYFLDHSSPELHDEVESHLAAVEPMDESDGAMPAFLAGRPLVVARARLGIELRGLPAAHLGTAHLKAAIAQPGAPRYAGGIEEVQIPVRLGDYGILDDGLVAYWEEPAPEAGPDEAHFTERERVTDVALRAPRTVTMLLDPRGAVHAATGLLPQKAIRVPRLHWAPALKRLEVGFAVGPILTAGLDAALPLPRRAGIDWHWVTNAGGQVARRHAPDPPSSAHWGEPPRLHEGWLVASRSEED